MKNLLISCIILISLSSCGSKIYSYRKTVKVNPTEISNKKYNGAARAYFTVGGQPTITASTAPVNVDPNTLYLTTKPVPSKKKKPSSSVPSSSAMVR